MLPSIDSADLITSVSDFVPELLLCVAIVFLLLLRLVKIFDKVHLGFLALVFTVLALGVSVLQWLGPSGPQVPVGKETIDLRVHGPGSKEFDSPPSPEYRRSLPFGYANADVPREAHGRGGLLVYDHLTIFLRCFLYSFAALVILLSMITGIPDREDSADFYVLLLGATLGMALMGMSMHLLMVFIAVEMASLPSYALAGFLKGKRQSSEAALKYVVYGGGAAGIMLYGISLLAGKFGTAYLPDLAYGFVTSLKDVGQGGGVDPVLVLGTLFFLVGIAFKLSAVPFHFWCPDVFEGASAEVAGFLSVASKGAALVLLARFVLVLGGLDPILEQTLGPARDAPWGAILRYLVPTLAFFAALTATFGNLAAYRQTNLKRLLAYSTIAHAGYMMMGLCTLTPRGVAATLFYLIAYLFMNLGAFAVVAFLRNQTRSEDLADFRGLVRRSPVMVVTLAFFLLSLLGMPPLVGFAAKFQVFAVLLDEGRRYDQQPQKAEEQLAAVRKTVDREAIQKKIDGLKEKAKGENTPAIEAEQKRLAPLIAAEGALDEAKRNAFLGWTLLALLAVGGVNTVISAVYYLKVLKVMVLDTGLEDLEGSPPPPLRQSVGSMIYAGLLAAAVLALFVFWDQLDNLSRNGVARFRSKPGGEPPQLAMAPKGPPKAKK